jgi:hypothetical protein
MMNIGRGRMRDNVERARDNGVSLGFFGANISYFQIRLEPSRTGSADRTIVCYKKWNEDPIRHSTDPNLARRITILFRNFRVGRPEDSMVGVMYSDSPVKGDIVVENTSHWVFEGTGLRDGDRLTGLLGYEADRVYGNAPVGTVRIGHSPYRVRGDRRYADMSVYSAAEAPTIFASGSMNWNLGLSEGFAGENSQGVPMDRNIRASVEAQQITRNVLRRFGAEPIP